MSNNEIILYVCLGIGLLVLVAFMFFGKDDVEQEFIDGMDWQKEKTQECIDLAERSLKAQEDMAQTLKDIKTILEKR